MRYYLFRNVFNGGYDEDLYMEPNLEREFVCKDCRKTFKRKSHLNAHIRQVHSQETPFQCLQCDRNIENYILC